MKGLTEDQFEIPVGTAANLVAGSRANFDQIFKNMNAGR